jgi:transcriptional regulator
MAHPFATLATANPLWATHLPIEWDFGPTHEPTAGHLHLAATNPQANALAEPGAQALVTVLGPHAYISPTAYAHPNVPTWNYVAAHLQVTVVEITDKDAINASLARLLAKHEPQAPQGHGLQLGVPKAVATALVAQLRLFTLHVQGWQFAEKLSQNRSDADYTRIMANLYATGPQGQAVAAEMARLRPHCSPNPPE